MKYSRKQIVKSFLTFKFQYSIYSNYQYILFGRMSKRSVQKFPLISSFVYHTLGTSDYTESGGSSSNPNTCTREFLDYIQKIGTILEKPLAKVVSRLIHDYIPTDKACEKSMRKMVQCTNLNLTPENAKQLFPDLMEEIFTYQGEYDTKKEIKGLQLYEEIYNKINQII